MGGTVVFISFAPVRVSEEFFQRLDSCILRHGFLAKYFSRVYSRQPRPQWTDFTWEERAAVAAKGSSIALGYKDPEDPMGSITCECDYNFDLKCGKVLLRSSAEGIRSSYYPDQRRRGLLLQAVSKCIHQEFNGIITRGMIENCDEPWFSFSHNRWKEFQDLPLIPPEEE